MKRFYSWLDFQRGKKFDHLSRNTREGSPEPDEGTGHNREERLTQVFMFRLAASVLLKRTLFSGWGHCMSRGRQGWGGLRTSLHWTAVAVRCPRANIAMSSTVTAMVTLTAVIATMLEPSTQHSETLTVLYVHTTVLSPPAGWTTKSVLTDWAQCLPSKTRSSRYRAAIH